MVAKLASPRLTTILLIDHLTVHVEDSMAARALDGIPSSHHYILGLKAFHGKLEHVGV